MDCWNKLKKGREMKFNPGIHHRSSIRLQGFDYSQPGAYFVTICTQNRKCLFGEIADGKMRLSAIGRIAAEQWNAIPQRFPNVELDEFVVMPNHIHGILMITVGALPTVVGAPLAGAPTVGDIVGAYKSLCVHNGLKWIKQNHPGRILGKLWQRNYWEHIIRNEHELNRIRKYIHNNPTQWKCNSLNAGTGCLSSAPMKIREPITEYCVEAVWHERGCFS